MINRCSESFRDGKRDGERSYSAYSYDHDKYDCYGSERQRDYVAGWDESREEKEREERYRQEREEEEKRQEQRRAYELWQQREQEYERQQYEEEMRQQEESEDNR